MLFKIRKQVCVLVILFFGYTAYGQIDIIGEKYYHPDSLANELSGYSLYNRLELVNKLVEPFDDDELKFRAIFTWICLNIENDYNAYLKNDAKRRKLRGQPDKLSNWNEEYRQKVIKTLLLKNKTVCSGYTYLLREMAALAGIDCVVIDGYGRDAYVNIKGESIPNHSWNAAKLNGKWYLFDATWASGVYDESLYSFVPSYDDVYFMTPAELFVLNHYPLDTSWLLIEHEYKLDDFLRGPIIYRPALHHQVRPVSPTTFSPKVRKGTMMKFFFESKTAIGTQSITLRSATSDGPKIISTELLQNNENQYYLEYRLNTRGHHVIHLYINDNALMTYEPQVVK